jgi:hypothetical protein
MRDLRAARSFFMRPKARLQRYFKEKLNEYADNFATDSQGP